MKSSLKSLFHKVMEETIGVVKHVPQERVQSNTAEDIVAVAAPRIRQETGQVIQMVPQDRISDLNGEQIADIPIPQIQEELVEMIQLMPRERKSECIVEQFVVMPAVLQQQAPVAQTMDESLHVSGRDKSTGRSNEIETTNQEGRWSHAEIDYMVKTAKKYRDKEKANKVKVGGQNGLESHGDPMGNNATVEKLKFKWKVGDEERTEKAVQDAPGWLDRKRLAEKDYFKAVWKILSARRQVPAVQMAQKTIDVPQARISDTANGHSSCT